MIHQNLSYSKLSIGQLIKMSKLPQWEAETALYDKLSQIAKMFFFQFDDFIEASDLLKAV